MSFHGYDNIIWSMCRNVIWRRCLPAHTLYEVVVPRRRAVQPRINSYIPLKWWLGQLLPGVVICFVSYESGRIKSFAWAAGEIDCFCIQVSKTHNIPYISTIHSPSYVRAAIQFHFRLHAKTHEIYLWQGVNKFQTKLIILFWWRLSTQFAKRQVTSRKAQGRPMK